jgi:hypothetical protein
MQSIHSAASCVCVLVQAVSFSLLLWRVGKTIRPHYSHTEAVPIVVSWRAAWAVESHIVEAACESRVARRGNWRQGEPRSLFYKRGSLFPPSGVRQPNITVALKIEDQPLLRAGFVRLHRDELHEPTGRSIAQFHEFSKRHSSRLAMVSGQNHFRSKFRMPSVAMIRSALAASRPLIFDCPRSRSAKTIGVSPIRAPARLSIHRISS